MWGLVERKCKWGLDRCGCFRWWVDMGDWGWAGSINELVYLVSVGVECVCKGL